MGPALAALSLVVQAAPALEASLGPSALADPAALAALSALAVLAALAAAPGP